MSKIHDFSIWLFIVLVIFSFVSQRYLVVQGIELNLVFGFFILFVFYPYKRVIDFQDGAVFLIISVFVFSAVLDFIGQGFLSHKEYFIPALSLFVATFYGKYLVPRLASVLPYFTVLNFLVLIYEKFSGRYFFNTDADLILQSSVAVYGKGLFFGAKGAAEFLIFSVFLMWRNLLGLLIVFASVSMVGVRAAMFFVGFAVVLKVFQVLRESSYRISARIGVIVMGIFIMISTYVASSKLMSMGRLQSVFDIGSPTYQARFETWGYHFQCISGLSLESFLFGAGNFCARSIGWGSENLLIYILESNGFLLLLVFLISYFVSIYRLARIDRCLSFLMLMLLPVMVVSRIPTGWFGMIVLMSFILLSFRSSKSDLALYFKR